MVYCLFYRIDPAIALRGSAAVPVTDVMVNQCVDSGRILFLYDSAFITIYVLRDYDNRIFSVSPG